MLIHYMNVPIDDLERARDFYGRVLGLPELERPDVGRPGLWFVCGAGELHLSAQPGLRGSRRRLRLKTGERADRAGGRVAFTMSGTLADIVGLLKAERIPYARGEAGLPQVLCEDPAGNLVELNTGWTPEPR